MEAVVRRYKLLLAAAAVAALAAGCGGEEGAAAEVEGIPDPLVFGLIPAEDNAAVIAGYEPVAEHIGEELGVEVELFTATDYSGIIEAMRSENVDVAWFGPLSYVLASEVADAEAVAQQIEEEGQEDPTYVSYIITREDSGIESLEDLEGGSFAFVDPASTSGNLFPRQGFEEADIDPDQDLAEITYAGGHDAAALAAENGDVDAAPIASTIYDNMVEEGALDEDELQIIHESEPIPNSPISVRGDLPPEVKEEVQDVFLDMTTEELGELREGIVGYTEGDDADYDPIRDLVDTLDLDLEELADE